MGPSDIKNEIRRLDIAERILLAEEIWDGVVEEQERVLASDAQKKELDRRIERYEKSPGEGSSWEKTKKKIKNEE